MKLSDYVVSFLAEQGIGHVFGLTGGAVVHLFDSAARNPNIRPIFTHHEQAAAFAAGAYARLRNSLGVAFVTTGPGGTNAVTGVCAAWLDSIPCVYISGQARLAHTTHGKLIRQLGVQQLDIVPLVVPITKYAVMIDDPKMIKYHLQKAVYIARSGRPGPVWIDIPLDFQWASIDPDALPCFGGSEVQKTLAKRSVVDHIQQCFELISAAERPIVLAGHGIRLAHAEREFRQLVETLKFPFLSTWNVSDLLATDNELYVGRPGIFGQRGANLAIQNCDLLLSIGSHLSIPLTGTMFNAFAREAKIIVVDVDQVELNYQTVRVDLSMQCDAKVFLQEMLRQAEEVQLMDIGYWRNKCSQYKSRYNKVPPEWRDQKEHVNPHVFISALSDELDNSYVIVVDGGGTVNQITFQAFTVKEGQRVIISGGLCAMGSGLPESIGACFGSGGRRTICLCGDGSIQLNVQELQTIVHHNLAVKIFVFNNGGYLAIRHTQDGFLESNYVGSSVSGGLSLPNLQKVAEAYGVKATRVNNHCELREKIRWVLQEPGPVLCEVMISKDQQVIPRQGFDRRPDGTGVPRPLEDMYPFLDREVFLENMVIKPWVEPES